MHPMYRSDIDGLRAIAVLSVIAFHINEEWLEGGFLGVDIFFVISGYLITLLLINEANKTDTISLSNFYERRIRRIMPALLLVIGCTLFSGLALMTPDYLLALCKSTLWSIASLANIHFYSAISTDYFADDSREVPLLHLWSLGVEEQFYLIWPLLLLFILTRVKENYTRITLTLSLLLASLCFAHFYLPSNPTFTYYMLPTRAWELMAGALVALLVTANYRTSKTVANLLSVLAFYTIYYSFKHVDKDDPVPGLAAAPAIIATALLIWTGSFQKTFISRFLSIKPMVAIGLVSYSAYLWHWPLLAFIRYGTADIELDRTLGIGALITTILLAALTYFLVEKPTRKSLMRKNQVFFYYLIFPALLICSASLFISHSITNRASWMLEWEKYDLLLTNQIAPSSAFLGCGGGKNYEPSYDNNPACHFPSGAALPKTIVVGDSNAEHFLPLIREFSQGIGFSFTHRTQSTCPFLLDKEPVTWIYPEYQTACQQYRETLIASINRYDTVIIGGSWTSHDKKKQRKEFRQRFEDTINKLVQENKRVIILGKIPRFSTYNKHCEVRAFRLPWLDCETRYDNDQPDHDANQYMQQLADQYPEVEYFGIRSQLCREERCSPYFQGIPAYQDGGHLNATGAIAIGKAMLSANDTSLSIFAKLAP